MKSIVFTFIIVGISSTNAEGSCNVRTTGGECCIFPFMYEGRQYYSCTTVDNKNTPWCYYKLTWRKKWGNCKEESTPLPTSRSTAISLPVSTYRSTAISLPVSTPLSTPRSTPLSTPRSTPRSTSRSTATSLLVSMTRALSLPTKTIVKTTKPSTSRSSPQAESNKESSHNLPVTYIIIPVIAGVSIILVVTIIFICIRRKRGKTVTSTDSRGLNMSYEMRKDATVSNQTDSDCYATPSSPAEKLWPGVTSISREGRNPVYEPGNETTYCSTDNETYEAADGAESKNPLYNASDVQQLYTEPTTSNDERYYDLAETSTELHV